MIPLSQTLLLSCYPRAMAGMAMALWGMTVLVAPVVGPLLGGWITDHIAWPWIFYINIPVGLLTAAVTWSIFRERETPSRRVPLDRVGLALLVLWVGAMQIMVDKGKELDWFGSTEIVLLALVAAVGFVFFLVWELGAAQPMVDLRLFARRNFVMGTVSLSVAYGLVFGNIVLLPLWLQQYMGYTATWAGLAMAPVGPVGDRALALGRQERQPRRSALDGHHRLPGFRGRCCGCARSSTRRPTSPPSCCPRCCRARRWRSSSSRCSPSPLPACRPIACRRRPGLSNFVRITAGAVGTSVFTTLWESRASLHHANLVQSISLSNPASVQALAGMEPPATAASRRWRRSTA